MVNLLCAMALLPQQNPQDKTKDQVSSIKRLDPTRPAGAAIDLPNPGFQTIRLRLQASNVPLTPPKLSPKIFSGQHWEFPWHTDGFVKVLPSDTRLGIRFRVFSQSHDEEAMTQGKEISMLATRELLRLWEFDANKLSIDHASDVHLRMVDVYLCDKGAPGGEQLFDTDTESGSSVKVNTIYIYSLPTLNDKLEEAREIAHEYGHAVLPAVGGYKSPEYWANGYLGEKLFLRWLRDGILNGKLTSDDAMGASLDELDHFVVTAVNPLIKEAAKRSPSSSEYTGHDESAMGAFEGIALWCDTILPPKMFGRSMALINGTTALDFVNAAVLAAEEENYSPKIPAYILGPVWIPVGDGVVSGAQVIRKDSGWELIKPTGKVLVTAPKSAL